MQLWTTLVVIGLLIGLVGVLVTWINRPDWQLKRVTEIVGSADSDVLRVTVAHSSCNAGPPRVRVLDETATVVVLRAEQNVRGDCTAESITTGFEVDLGSRLGNRQIRMQEAGGPMVCRIEDGHRDQCP